MSRAEANSQDQYTNEQFFIWYAGKDLSKWNLILGTPVTEAEEGKGEIVGFRESEKYGVFFSIRFEKTPDKEQEYIPLALEKGIIVFSRISKEFEEIKALYWEDFIKARKRLDEEKRKKEKWEEDLRRERQERQAEEIRRKEIKEQERAALQEYKNLYKKYQVPYSHLDTPVEMLFVILLKLENNETLSKEDLNFLERRKAFFALAQYYELLCQKTEPEPWDCIKASKYYRRVKDPKKALEITEGVSSTDPKTNSAILVTRGAAYKDLKNFAMAEQCANEALNFDKNSYHAYNLLGAIAFQKGDLEESEGYFEKAIELGSKPQGVDAAMRDAIEKADPEEKIKAAEYLIRKDPVRYKWASHYLKGGKK